LYREYINYIHLLNFLPLPSPQYGFTSALPIAFVVVGTTMFVGKSYLLALGVFTKTSTVELCLDSEKGKEVTQGARALVRFERCLSLYISPCHTCARMSLLSPHSWRKATFLVGCMFYCLLFEQHSNVFSSVRIF
jgi:hypothetical protein